MVDGTPLRMVGCHVDITARMNAEEALRVSEELLREAQNTAHIATGRLIR